MTQETCPFCSRWNDEPELRIAELEHSYLMLNRDQYFTGYCFLFAKEHLTDFSHLARPVQHGIIDEMTTVAKVLQNLYAPDKINYELLGNMVPHIHWHIVPRFRSDRLWPRPIWSEAHPEKLLTREEYCSTVISIQQGLA